MRACNPLSFLLSAPRPGALNVVLLWTARDRWSAPQFLMFKQALELEEGGSGTHRSTSKPIYSCGRSFPRSGETVFGLPETEGPELPLKRSFFPAETASRPCAPAKPRVFVKPREISVSMRVRGGACSPLSTSLGSQIP